MSGRMDADRAIAALTAAHEGWFAQYMNAGAT
jgi:hypothetical protein